MSLINAANGGAMSIYDNGYGKILQDDSSNKWLVSNLTTNDAHNALKLAIAQNLGSSDSVNYDYLINNKTADVNNNIFVNSIVEDIDEYNFIKFTFDNNIDAKFTVTFDGYYDKR